MDSYMMLSITATALSAICAMYFLYAWMHDTEKKRRNVPQSQPEQTWDEDVNIFIVAPPGFGSIMKPNFANIRHGILFRSGEELARIRKSYGMIYEDLTKL